MENKTAIVRIAPEKDEKVAVLYNEGIKLRDYAVTRTITCNEDMKPATDDLAIIAKTKKAIEEVRREYVNPIRHHLDAVNTAFKEFTAPLVEADTLNRTKIKDYRTEVERKRTEAEAIEQERLELAKREEALTGEHTIELKEVEKPEEASKRVHTELGSTGTQKIYKWELVDINLVPREYLMVNASLVQQQVKTSKGSITIPGIRVFEDEVIRVNTR